MCPYVTAQQLLAGKWAILILQKLSQGTKRYNELQREIDITQTTLANQLKTLEAEGLIHREAYAEVPLRVEYSLTEIGEQFKPVLNSIEQWGNQYKYIEYLKQEHSKQSD
ncbi:MAG: helix-turn-helix transcriptional regulator [Ruminococcus sp.]|nr:helix-turn-helix transcriptional regulator [Ruminococcus sp.]